MVLREKTAMKRLKQKDAEEEEPVEMIPVPAPKPPPVPIPAPPELAKTPKDANRGLKRNASGGSESTSKKR